MKVNPKMLLSKEELLNAPKKEIKIMEKAEILEIGGSIVILTILFGMLYAALWIGCPC